MGEDSYMPALTPQSDTQWLRREIDRLDKQKADKLYVTSLKEYTERELSEAKLSFAKDITSLNKDFEKLENLFNQHPCNQEEEIADMNAMLTHLNETYSSFVASQEKRQAAHDESKKYWSRWVASGIVGFFLLLLGSGGSWLYSYYNIQAKTEEAQQTSTEVRSLVSQIQQTQQAQTTTLEKITQDTERQTLANREQLRQDLKTSIIEALQEKKGLRNHE
jgi:hypothetical protein